MLRLCLCDDGADAHEHIRDLRVISEVSPGLLLLSLSLDLEEAETERSMQMDADRRRGAA